MHKQPLTPRDERVLAELQRVGKDGLGTGSIVGMPAVEAERSLRKLLRHGLAFKGKLSHRTMRHFSTQAWASAFEAHKLPSDTKPRASARIKATWPVDAPIHFPTNPDGSPAWKHTVIPTRQEPTGAIRTTFYKPI